MIENKLPLGVKLTKSKFFRLLSPMTPNTNALPPDRFEYLPRHKWMFKSPHEEYLVISSCPPQKPGAVQSKLTAHHKKMTLHCPSQTKLGPPELIAAAQPPRHAGHVSRVSPPTPVTSSDADTEQQKVQVSSGCLWIKVSTIFCGVFCPSIRNWQAVWLANIIETACLLMNIFACGENMFKCPLDIRC